MTNVSGPYSLVRPLLAYVLTSPSSGNPSALLALEECALPAAGDPAAAQVVALTLAGEGCGVQGSGPFEGGAVLRGPGWVAASFTAAAALGWSAVLQPATNATLGASPVALWRCKGSTAAAALVYSASAGDPSCASAGAGYSPDRLLGYALGPLAEL